MALTVALAYIGDRLGIFKAMADGALRTSPKLAEHTGLDERYLREWAATMAASGYLDFNARDETFRLNPEQALVLAHEDSTFFMGGGFQYAVACYGQLPKLMDSFQHGGGVPFSDFGSDIVEAIERLFSRRVRNLGGPGVDSAGARYSLATDGWGRSRGNRLWSRTVPRPGCDGGSDSRFFVYHVDRFSIERAREKAMRAGISNRVTFERIAAEELPYADRFDLVTAFNCIHDMAQPRSALAALRRIVKPAGACLWSEAHAGDRLEENLNPQGRTMYAASTMHCMTVSLAQGGEGLGSLIGESKARGIAHEAGFTQFEKLLVKNPIHQIFVLRR